VPPALPKTEFGKGLVLRKNSKLAPKHQGAFSGSFGDHDVWYVYALVLCNERNKSLAVKIGYSNEPEAREAAHNTPLAHEVTGLYWKLEFKQPTSSEDAARDIEQAVLGHFKKHQLASNGEIISGVDPMLVAAKIGTVMREMAA
jgi:T5orf172 domain